MLPFRRSMAHAIACALLLAACGEVDSNAADSARAAEAGAVQPVDSTTIARLAAQFPVLRASAAPAPQPSPDAGREVPPRVREAAPQRVLRTVTGEATFYADVFEGRRTASGIPFRQNQMVAAHRGFPFGTLLRVTNLRNDRSVTVRVVDRGPWGAKAAARNTIIDLSRRAAGQLGYIDAGRTPVRVEVLEWGRGVSGSV